MINRNRIPVHHSNITLESIENMLHGSNVKHIRKRRVEDYCVYDPENK